MFALATSIRAVAALRHKAKVNRELMRGSRMLKHLADRTREVQAAVSWDDDVSVQGSVLPSDSPHAHESQSLRANDDRLPEPPRLLPKRST